MRVLGSTVPTSSQQSFINGFRIYHRQSVVRESLRCISNKMTPRVQADFTKFQEHRGIQLWFSKKSIVDEVLNPKNRKPQTLKPNQSSSEPLSKTLKLEPEALHPTPNTRIHAVDPSIQVTCLWLPGNEGVEKKMETTIMGYIWTTRRTHSDILS